ncbi:MAG: PAS domain S-box protein, partial [Sterolibacterium sp.]|nr:PAS domain S-box protein [Sterolibacterium sp.]
MTSSSESAPGSSFPYPSARWLLAVLGLALVYTALGGLIIRGFGSVQVMNLFWPPQGIALAVILLFGRNLWPGVLLGSFTGILLVGVPPWLATLLSALNAFEILLCHYLLRRVWNINLSLATTHDFLLLLLTSALSSCLTALVGSTLLYLGDALVTPTFLQSFGHWWQSELLGLMLVTPLCLFWWPSPDKPPLRVKLAIECVLCLGLAFLCGQIILIGWQRPLFSTIMLDYWLIPFMIWAAVRCGRRAVSLLLLMIAVQGLIGAFSGQGYFAEDLRDAGLANLWFFIVILCGVGYTLATLLNERQQKTLELQRARKFSDDILLSMPGIFYLIDLQGKLLRWNPAYSHITGYNDEELNHIQVLDLIAPEDRTLIAERMTQAFTEGYAQTDAHLLSKYGQKIPYHFTGCRTTLNGQTYIIGLGIDISERKQAEQAMQESETRYRSLFEHGLMNTVIFDAQGTILMINSNAARALGAQQSSALVGRCLYDHLPPHQLELYKKRYAATLAGHDVGVREDCYPGLNGDCWYATRMHTVRNAAGEVYGLQMMSFDITARKQLELETRANELKYRQLIENTSTFITIIDGNGIIQLVNQANADMFGLSVDELIGKSLRELDPEHAEQFIERYRHILSSGDAMTTEDAFPLPNETRWFHAHSRPMYNVDGKAVAVQVVAFDITERCNMEDALRRSEALWRFALEGAGDAIWQHDLTTRQIHFSARWQEMLGFKDNTRDGVTDLQHFLDEIHPEDQAEVLRTFEHILAGKADTHNTEARFRCNDGSWKWILARGMVSEYSDDGQPLRIIGTCTDISFFKDHQKQLEYLAHFDTLTNLPNRTLLGLRLKQAMAQSLRRN